ncbi:Repeat domain-containing protein [Fictibacillus solisalsi]|uniref:Repeat domain-containing protein n=1 Tax=Fictibacillus solisalsi TaxID=459525 RepID=A0A1H0BQ51_9BACL|nr:CRTAC1 family protein [Fictibacillus solisalsi]SDN47732.1 Repeat domain-containing protein [Fictibacillus solisalsi]
MMKPVVKKVAMLVLVVFVILLSACQQEAKVNYGFKFKDITQSTEINFTHQKPQFDKKVSNVMPWLASTGAGVFLNDYNNDGKIDVYLINSKKGSSNKLYKNKGNNKFEDVTDQAGIGDVNKEGISETALWFDYDNDGFQDLFVGAWGKSQLFKNNGDGTFTNVTESSGLKAMGYAAKAIAIDYNRDGNLDLYIGNYFRKDVDLWNLKSTKIFHNDFEKARNGGENYFFKNNGDGTFTEIGKKLNLDDTGWTLATGMADINNDGYPDIYNANDFGADSLLINKAGKRFEKITQHRGIGEDTYKSMNVDFADVFHDGNFANYVSNISKQKYLLEGNQLWHMNSKGKYVDRAKELDIFQSGWSWGARFFDVNNSGNLSLVVTNGFITGKSRETYWFDMGTLATTPGNIVEDAKNWPAIGDKDMSGHEQKSLFLNQGKTFPDVAKDVGITFKKDGRGVAVGDLDNNGTLDLFFANQGAKPKVYTNIQKKPTNWIKIDLKGTPPSNREAIGARLTFHNNGIKTVVEKDGGNSFGSQSDPRIHLGLGKSETLDQLDIRWPSGKKEVFKNIKSNQILSIVEGKGSYKVISKK